MNKIFLTANREANYVFHMLSVARCGYDNEYGAAHRGAYPEEDLAVLKKHERLITAVGGEHCGELFGLLVCLPARGDMPAGDFYRELVRQADAGEVPEFWIPLAQPAREIADVMARYYERYAAEIWPESRRKIETYNARVSEMFEGTRFSERAEEAVGCALPVERFTASMVNSAARGAQAIDISEEQDIFGIDRSPADNFRFIAHEFVIYLLFHALKDEERIRQPETWLLTEALAEHYATRILADDCIFGEAREQAEFYRRCEAEKGTLTPAELYRMGLENWRGK